MRIRSTHLPWAIFSVAVLVGGGCWYHFTAKTLVNGPGGSTKVGLTFGIIAAIFMYLVGGLSLRRRLRSWRVGSARLWLRGHLWLGFLILPLVWYHAGFRNGAMHAFFYSGGLLTVVIMYLLYAVWLTGIYGIILQQFLPTGIKNKVPNERLWSQIGPAMDQLRVEASSLAGSSGPIADLYRNSVAPFLSARPTRSSYLAVTSACAQTQASLDPPAHATVDQLIQVCDDYQHLAAERRMLFWLHSWLLIHVPLSMALLLLTAVHIIMALRLVI